MSFRARQRRATDGPPAVELLEESVHLLRGAPASAFAIYALGAVPWLGAFLHFWAHLSWFAPTPAERAWAAFGVALAFVWLQITQAEFAARLYAHRIGNPPAPLTPRRLRTLAGAQLRVQVWCLLALPIAVLSIVPFPWIYGFFQTATVLGATPDEPSKLRREAAELVRLWPKEHWRLLLCVAAFGAVVLVNLLTSTYVLPWLANRLLGIENVFSLGGLAFMNTTFLTIVGALTWLAMDPLLKSIYVLRVFHGRAQHTGEDLREAFFRARAGKTADSGGTPRPAAGSAPASAGRSAAVALVLAAVAFGLARGASAANEPPLEKSTPVVAEPPPGSDVPAAAAPELPGARVAPAELDRALDEALRDSDFQWSLRPLPSLDKEAEGGPVWEFLEAVLDWITDVVRRIGRAIGGFIDWLLELIFGKRGGKQLPAGAGRGFAGLGDTMVIVLFVVVVIALIWVLWVTFRGLRRAPAALAAAPVGPSAAPDLRDETLTAAQLPADGWLTLAREQIAAGNWRLAWRALYLATLARLADEGFVALARHKTNLDYERELARRALTRAELIAGFRDRRRGFEDVWYGNVSAQEEAVRAWLREIETPPPPAAAVPPPAPGSALPTP